MLLLGLLREQALERQIRDYLQLISYKTAQLWMAFKALTSTLRISYRIPRVGVVELKVTPC